MSQARGTLICSSRTTVQSEGSHTQNPPIWGFAPHPPIWRSRRTLESGGLHLGVISGGPLIHRRAALQEPGVLGFPLKGFPSPIKKILKAKAKEVCIHTHTHTYIYIYIYIHTYIHTYTRYMDSPNTKQSHTRPRHIAHNHQISPEPTTPPNKSTLPQPLSQPSAAQPPPSPPQKAYKACLQGLGTLRQPFSCPFGPIWPFALWQPLGSPFGPMWPFGPTVHGGSGSGSQQARSQSQSPQPSRPQNKTHPVLCACVCVIYTYIYMEKKYIYIYIHRHTYIHIHRCSD